jgi:hypothetical protein
MFLLSFATLLLELALTRVLSVALWYHFSFLVISTAMLGFGASGVAVALWTGLRERAPLDRTLAVLSIGFGVATIVSFAGIQHLPFDLFTQAGGLSRDAVMLAFYYLVLALPFFWSGLAIALLLTRRSHNVNRLYAADLLGAGAGCAALAAVLPVVGGSGSVVLAAAVGFLAAAVFGFPRDRRIGSVAAVLCGVALSLAWFADEVLPVAVSASKHHALVPGPPRPAPLFTAWNAISRIDVYPLPAAPDLGWPAPGFVVVIDGGSAATGMVDLSAGVEHWLARPDFRPPGLAYVGTERPRVLILGSGAGREVMEALYFGASSVTAVEMNPIITDLVSRRMRNTLGGLFEQPGVRLVTEEARSFVRRSGEAYDAIVSVQTNSNAALASGALGLAESYMFTREAIEDYLDHLTADGVLLITRSPNQVARLFATVREVFERRGLGSPARHLLAIQTPPMLWGPRHGLTVFLFKKSAWTPDDVRVLVGRLTRERPARAPAGGAPFEILYSPFESSSGERSSGSAYHEILTVSDLRKVYASLPFDVSPAIDDRPFFNQQARWSQVPLFSLGSLTAPPALNTGATTITPARAETMLVVLLAQVTIIAAVLILLPLARHSRQGLRVSGRWSFLTYFAGLGLGFIMIEIALLQRFILFLGEPVYALTVVLGSLLIFTGVGAYAGQSLAGRPGGRIAMLLLAIVTTLALTTLAMDWVFHAALGLALPLRIAIATGLVAPLGILLGMPFPAGLRVVGVEAPSLIAWAWGVNGFFTVIGSVLAMIVGMVSGFTAVLVVGGTCYAVCLVVAPRRPTRRAATS